MSRLKLTAVSVEDTIYLTLDLKGAILENQKPNDQLKDFEEEANRLKTVGNIAGALETLDEAIAIEKRWYHLFTKACWLYELEKPPESWEAIQEGMARFPTHRFWFFYLRAQYRYLKINAEISKNSNMQALINESIESQKDINSALEIVVTNKDNIKRDLENLPLLFPQNWKDCDVNDIIHKVQNLKNEILSTYRTLNLFSYVNNVQDDFKEMVEEQNQVKKRDELQHQSNLAYYNAVTSAKLEQCRIVNQAGQSALKACVFLNAGSAVAILALLVNVWEKTEPDIGTKIIAATSLFAFGALMGSVSTGITYLTLYASEANKNTLAHYLNLSANGLVLISYNLFIIGVYLALVGIGKHYGINVTSIKHINLSLLLFLIVVNVGAIILFYNVLKKDIDTDKANNE